MEDLTLQMSTVPDLTEQMATDQEDLDYSLTTEESLLATEQARYIFGQGFTPIITEDERVALNQVLADDINEASLQGEIEAQSELIATGQMTTVEDVQAMQQTLNLFRMSDQVALEEAVAYKAQAQAMQEGDLVVPWISFEEGDFEKYIRTTPEYGATIDLLNVGVTQGFNPADIHAKEQILLRKQQELKNSRGWGEKAAYGVADVFVPFFEAGRLKASSPDNKWNESVYVSNPTFIDRAIGSSMTPAQFEAWLDGYLGSMSRANAALVLESFIDRPMFLGATGAAVDLLSGGAVGKAAVKGASAQVKLAKILAKEGIKVPAKQVAKEATKAGVKEAAKAAVSEIPLATTVVNATSHPVKFFKNLGLRKEFARKLAEKMSEVGSKEWGLDKVITEEAVHTAASTRGTAENITSVASSAEMKAQSEYFGLLKDADYEFLTKAGALSQMERESLEAARVETLNNFKNTNPDATVNFADVDYFFLTGSDTDAVTALRGATGSYTFRYKIGTGLNGDKPFGTKAAAQTFAKANSISGDLGKGNSMRIVADKSGFWIQLDMKSATTPEELMSDRFIKSAQEAGAAEVRETADEGFTTSVRGTTVRSTPIRRATILAAHEKESVIYSTLVDGLKTIDRLDKTEKGILETLISKSRQEQTWVSPAWMEAQGVPERVIQAYQTRRLLNDLEYLSANRQLRKQLTEEGYKDVYYSEDIKRFKTEPTADDLKNLQRSGLEQELNFDSSLDPDLYFFRIDGASEPIDLTKEQLAQFKAEGYRMTQSPYGYNEIPAQQIRNLYHPKKYFARSVPEHPINYVPGGRSFYSSDNIFIKQLKTATAGDVKYISGVDTLTAGTSVKAMKHLAEQLEDARGILIRFTRGEIDAARATQLLQASKANGLTYAGTIQDFQKWAKEHFISLDPDTPFEAVEDGRALASYETLMGRKNVQDLDGDVNKFKKSASNLYSKEQLLNKRHRSGGDLEQLDMDYAPKRMSAMEEAKKLVNNIINHTTMDAYTRYYADNFKRIYSRVLQDNVEGYRVLNLQALKPKTDGNAALWDSAAAAIRQYETIRGVPNRFDEKLIRAIDKFFIPFVGEDLVRKVHKLELLDQARQAASHLTFLFSPAQMLKQFSSIANTHLLNLGASLEADKLMMLYPVFKNVKNEDALKKALKVVGFEPEQVAEYTKFFDNIDSIISRGRYFEGGMLRGDLQKTFIETGYYFFSKGENGNRLHSAIAAAITHGGKGVDNILRKQNILDLPKEQYAEFLNTYSRYYMNMDGVGSSALQTSSVAQSLLQFQTYKMRFFEVWFDTELSLKQRLGFYGAHLALFGAMGMGFSNIFSGSDDNALMYTFTHGVVDSAMHQLFEGNEFIPSLGGLGSSSVGDLGDIALTSFGDQISELPIVRGGGALATLFFDGVKTVHQAIEKPLTFEQYVSLSWDYLTGKKNPATGMSRTLRSGEAILTGKLKNSRGIETATVTKADAILNLLGVNNLVSMDAYRSYNVASKDTEELKKLAKDLSVHYTRGIQAGAQGPDWDLYKMKQYEAFEDLTPEQQRIVMDEMRKQNISNQKSDERKLTDSILRNRLRLEPETLIRDYINKYQGEQ